MVSLNAFLGFKFFSPSKLAVSINATPPYAELDNKIKSAGNNSSEYTLQMSPITT